MRGLIQRVASARVEVDGRTVGEIEHGILLFLAVQKHDGEAEVRKLLDRVLAYRVFGDANGQMNLSLRDVAGGLLIVSQFTLAANTRKGLRPSFSAAAQPADAECLYDRFVAMARDAHPVVAAGRFAAHMDVHLVNDGPVTFLLEV